MNDKPAMANTQAFAVITQDELSSLRAELAELRARAEELERQVRDKHEAATVDEICNAYESGVGHRGRPTANVNPYRQGSDLATAYNIGALGDRESPAEVPDDVAKDAIPAGWVFYSADASIQSSDPRRPIGVMLKRDIDGVQWWLQLTEEEKERTQLYSSGAGMTLELAIQNAVAAILAAKENKP